MSNLYAVFLGIVQGLSEFLPVSSSGHLVILQSLLPNFSQPGILFDVILHFGTLIAVLFYFRKKLMSYLNTKFILLLIIGTVPAVIVGYLIKDRVDVLFASVKVVGVSLLVTGVFNLLTDKFKAGKDTITNRNAFVTGVLQAVAIIPGISRSGSTIFASVAQGISKEKAAEFSFLLSVPAILGANILEIYNNGFLGFSNPVPYALGFLSSFIFGLIAMILIFKVIAKGKFEYFAYYCFFLGAIAIFLL
jgi:undecaprenyl-diphosphatase